MKAFVTGATGLLGSNLVRLLLAQGHGVKALARSPEKARRVLGDTTAEIVIGDMEDVGAFAPHMAGCDVLFHGAAYFREYYRAGDHWPVLKRINVDAVVEILTAAEQQGVKKAIHVSSSGLIGREGDQPGDESTPPLPFAYENLYFKSKILAEEAVQRFLQTHDLPVVLILPGWMMGPGDAAPTDSGRMILDLLHSAMPGMIEGGNSIVDARDVAQGMINAVELGRSGERYIIGGTYHSLAEVAATVEAASGVPAPRRRIPYPLAISIAWVSETVARLRDRETLMTINGIRTLREGLRLDSSKAQLELGVSFRPLQETIADEISWFAAHGYVRPFVDLTQPVIAPKLAPESS